MKRLPDGMYHQGTSPIHRLDATIKILLLILLIVAVILTNTWIGYGILVLFTGMTILISKVGIHAAFGSVTRLIWFFAVIFLMNLCFFKSDNAWVKFWIFTPSYEGLMQGVNVVARVVFILIFSNILNVSTPPVEVTNAIENIISPLRFIKVPTRQIALIISVAIQFIPILFEETDMIKKAQTARGAKFYSKNLKDKAGAVIPMVVPIFISAFRRADELSLAMEARGYRVDVKYKKTRTVHIGAAEIISLAICSALCAVQIILCK